MSGRILLAGRPALELAPVVVFQREVFIGEFVFQLLSSVRKLFGFSGRVFLHLRLQIVIVFIH